MCSNCDDINKSEDWKEILKEDIEKQWGNRSPGQGYGTRQTHNESQYGSDYEGFGEDQIQERTEQYHEGMKCFYCDEDAEWKCTNGKHGGCRYEGDRFDGVQVCGANSEFASDEYPEGHKTYANRNNSGHSWVPIDEFPHDDEWGYNQDKGRKR